MRSGVIKANVVKITTDVEGPRVQTQGMTGTMAANFFNDTMTTTEAAAAYCKVYDASATTTFYNLAVSSTNTAYAQNYQLFPGTEAINDAIYFGAATKFGAIHIDMSATVQTYSADGLTWEYYNGTGWGSFTPYDTTDGTAQDGKRSFGADGYILLNVGSDWTPTTIDSQLAYWVRARCTAATITQAGVTNSKEHEVMTCTAGTRVKSAGTVSRALFRYNTLSSGAGNDSEVVLNNLTRGYTSSNLTLTKNLGDIAVTLSLDVEVNDQIVWFCTTVNGTVEYANGIVELEITRRT